MWPTFENQEIVFACELQYFLATLKSRCHTGGVATVLQYGYFGPQIEQIELTGTVYKTFGFGFPTGQFSKISRNK
jgi:hypothetical protein